MDSRKGRSSGQEALGAPTGRRAAIADLLFFDYSPTRPGIDHVGIYLGDDQIIAAPRLGDVVKTQSVGQRTLIRRVLPDEAL